jgi:alpha-L-rhamnosidase
MGGGGGPGGWGSAIVFVPYAFFREFGELDVLCECYEPMRRYMDYLDTRSEDGIIVREEEKGWCLGDWCTLEKTIIPEAYVNTCYFVKMLATLCEIAHILGKDDDISAYEEKISALKEAIKAKFFDDETGEYCKGIQGASAYSVWAGLEGAPTAAILAKKYDELGHFDTGFLGTDILLEVLFDYGYEDVALKLLESSELGSFLYMKNHGATTIWEDWDGKNSHNHPMFGACVRHFYTAILGIGRDGANVSICPKIPKKLSYIRGALTSPYGKIGVEAERKGEDIAFTVDIPLNISAYFAYDGEMMELHSGKNEILIRGAK